LAEQSTIEVGQTVVEGHVSLTLPGVEHVAVAGELLAVAGEGVVGANASEIILGLSNNNTTTTRRKETTVVNCILNVLGAILVVVLETLMVEFVCSIQA